MTLEVLSECSLDVDFQLLMHRRDRKQPFTTIKNTFSASFCLYRYNHLFFTVDVEPKSIVPTYVEGLRIDSSAHSSLILEFSEITQQTSDEKVDKPPDTTMDTSGPTLTDDEKAQITKILEQQNPDALAAQVAKIFRQKFQKELEEKTSNEGESNIHTHPNH